MSLSDKRLSVLIGAYGSGKSEVSVNLALQKRKKHDRVLIADMDIVNPFYRSADAEELLRENDIRLIAPLYAGSNVDAPVLTGEMYVIFDDPSYAGVFDIGGEDMGANILGSMRTRLAGIDHDLLMVVNTLRPFTSDPDGIAAMASELTDASRGMITGFINNTNLLEQTAPDDIKRGEEIILKASELCGIPLLATAVMGIPLTDLTGLASPEVIELRRTIRYDY